MIFALLLPHGRIHEMPYNISILSSEQGQCLGLKQPPGLYNGVMKKVPVVLAAVALVATLCCATVPGTTTASA